MQLDRSERACDAWRRRVVKIQLVHPPVYLNPAALTALRPAPPLGLAYVAAALRRAGHQVSVIDAVAEAPTQHTPEGAVVRLGLADAAIVERIEPDTEVVGITNMWTFAWPAVRSLIHAVRARHPGMVIVCGGEHFTGMPEHSMARITDRPGKRRRSARVNTIGRSTMP